MLQWRRRTQILTYRNKTILLKGTICNSKNYWQRTTNLQIHPIFISKCHEYIETSLQEDPWNQRNMKLGIREKHKSSPVSVKGQSLCDQSKTTLDPVILHLCVVLSDVKSWAMFKWFVHRHVCLSGATCFRVCCFFDGPSCWENGYGYCRGRGCTFDWSVTCWPLDGIATWCIYFIWWICY